jgi:hypothetical protein
MHKNKNEPVRILQDPEIVPMNVVCNGRYGIFR